MISVQFKFACDKTTMPPQKRLKIWKSEIPSSSSTKGKKEPKADTADWRSDHWRQRLHYAQTNNLLCDVTFDVEGRELRAHKLILAMASPVFEAMFYGAIPENGDKVVITDLTAEGFKKLLEYIYKNDASLSTMEEALQLWVAADKYCVPQVRTTCVAFFKRCPLPPECVWSTLQTALFLDIKQVVDRCLCYLGEHTEVALAMEDFTHINHSALSSFLNLDCLCASELTLLRSLVKWGQARVKGQPDITLQQAVEPCIKYIRFGVMTPAEFCQFLDDYQGVVTDSDALAIMKHLTKPTAYPLPQWCSPDLWERTPTAPKEEDTGGPSRPQGGGGVKRGCSSSGGPSSHMKITHFSPCVFDFRSTSSSSSSSSSSSDDSSSSFDSDTSEEIERRRTRERSV